MTQVDHPEIDEWSVDYLWDDEVTWQQVLLPFRNQVRRDKISTLAGGFAVHAAIFFGVVSMVDGWRLVEEGAPSSSLLAIRFWAAALPIFGCQIYYFYATFQGKGWLWNPILLPFITEILVDMSIITVFPSLAPLTDRPDGLVPIVVIGTPIAIAVGLLVRWIGNWVPRNPRRALEWEEQHLPVAMFSHILVEEGQESLVRNHYSGTPRDQSPDMADDSISREPWSPDTEDDVDPDSGLISLRFGWITTEGGIMKLSASAILLGTLVMGLVWPGLIGWLPLIVWSFTLWTQYLRWREEVHAKFEAMGDRTVVGSGFAWGLLVGGIFTAFLAPAYVLLGAPIAAFFANELELRGAWWSPARIILDGSDEVVDS